MKGVKPLLSSLPLARFLSIKTMAGKKNPTWHQSPLKNYFKSIVNVRTFIFILGVRQHSEALLTWWRLGILLAYSLPFIFTNCLLFLVSDSSGVDSKGAVISELPETVSKGSLKSLFMRHFPFLYRGS